MSYRHLEPDIENIQDNDTAMDVEPKPKEITKLAERPVYPKLVKSSKAKGPKSASSKSKEVDQRNLATDEGSKSDHNCKLLFFLLSLYMNCCHFSGQ